MEKKQRRILVAQQAEADKKDRNDYIDKVLKPGSGPECHHPVDILLNFMSIDFYQFQEIEQGLCAQASEWLHANGYLKDGEPTKKAYMEPRHTEPLFTNEEICWMTWALGFASGVLMEKNANRAVETEARLRDLAMKLQMLPTRTQEAA